MIERLRAYCEQPRAPWLICLFGVLLASPALFVGLCGDDFIHGLILTHSRQIAAYATHDWTRLFEFASPTMNPALSADGILAWWADPNFKLAFFRPLSALTHALDYALWPTSPALMHAHNLLFFVVVLAVVFRLYEQLLPRWAAVLALFFYAVDPTRAITITWIANRNALIACALSSYAVLEHIRALHGTADTRWLRYACFAAAMLSGEGAIGGCAYLFAAELCFASDAYRRRALRLLPYALIAPACVVTARSLGYGVVGSGEYLDPIGNTGAYLRSLPGRALALLGAELALFNAEWWNAYDLLLPGMRALFIAIASGALLFWTVVFTPLVRRSRSACFFACGALLALLPAVATFPNGRTLGWVSIGVMGLAAEYVASAALFRDAGRFQRGLSRVAVVVILLLHGVSGTLALPGGCRALSDVNLMLDRADGAVPSDPSIRARTVVFVNPPQDPTISFIPPTRAFRGIPRPFTQHWLATGLSPLRITRSDAQTLEVEPRDGFVHEQTERVVRARPFVLGERIELPGLTVEVSALTPDGRPARARFHFEHALEDPSYVWLAWHDEGFVAFQPPPLAATIELPRIDFATMLLGAHHPVTQLLAGLRAKLPPEP